MANKEPGRLLIHDQTEDFSKKTFEQAEAKKKLVRNLKSLVRLQRRVSIRRKNLLKAAGITLSGGGDIQSGMVAKRHIGETEWRFVNVAYNRCHNYAEAFPSLIGTVVGYELDERSSGGSAYLIVAADDGYEYRFNIHFSEVWRHDSMIASAA